MDFDQHEINIFRQWYDWLAMSERALLNEQDHALAARLPKPGHHSMEANGLVTRPPGLPKL